MATFIPINDILTTSQALTPAATATITSAEQTFTVTGLTTSMNVLSVKPAVAQTAGLGLCQARVTATDTLGLTFVNPTAGSLTAVASTYTIVVQT